MKKTLAIVLLVTSTLSMASTTVQVPVNFKNSKLEVKHYNSYIQSSCLNDDCSEISVKDTMYGRELTLNKADFTLNLEDYGAEVIPVNTANDLQLGQFSSMIGDGIDHSRKKWEDGSEVASVAIGVGTGILAPVMLAGEVVFGLPGELLLFFKNKDERKNHLKRDVNTAKKIAKLVNRIAEGGAVKFNTADDIMKDLTYLTK